LLKKSDLSVYDTKLKIHELLFCAVTVKLTPYVASSVSYLG